MKPLRRPKISILLKMGVFSLLLHILLVVLLTLNPWPTFIKPQPRAYTVTLMPVTMRESEIPPPLTQSVTKEEKIEPVEKIKPKAKPIEKPKKNEIVEKVKKKEIDEQSLKRLQKALEEIRKKAALDEIQKRIAQREKREEPTSHISATSITPAELESKLNEYYGRVWLKIKESWTIPENLIKEIVDLESIIVLIIGRDGKVQKWWFEKKSGNNLYDQSVARAIKKADPLPPIPKELGEKSLEIGIRFYPE